ncbi:LysR family transcriptional regulator, partial [Enterovirga sp. CN4-39]|uniref:LysR family transcriptional regulator n=1 Tax=Enterovirga sp. CN4-39 TaxID=3400910 RepID=UPI003C10926F
MRAFVHVADQRSFSRAASVLRVTQPALSRQIRQLEDDLGTKLFHRHGHGVALTNAGAILFERCKRILSDVEDLRSELGRQLPRPGITGTTTLGVPAPMAWRFAHPFLSRFRQQFPGITLRIVEGFSAFLHEWLLSGTVDLAIMYGPRPSKIIDATELLIEDLFAIGDPKFANRKTISIDELSKYPLIVPHPPHVIRSLAHEAGLQPARFVEVDALSLMVELAHHGEGFSVLPMTAVRQELI